MQVTSKDRNVKMNVWDLINTVRSQQFIDQYKDSFGAKHGGLLNPNINFQNISDLKDIDKVLNAPIQHNDETIQNNRTFDMVSDVTGSVVNIDAYLNGEPEDMYNFVSSESNIVEELKLFIAVSGGYDVANIQKAAERIHKYIITRPANIQFNVTLISNYTLRIKGPIYKVELIISSADDYFTDQIINLLGHAMLYRYFLLCHRFCIHNSNTFPAPMPEDCIDFCKFNKTWEQ